MWWTAETRKFLVQVVGCCAAKDTDTQSYKMKNTDLYKKNLKQN